MTSFGIFAISQPNTNDSARSSEVPIQTCCVFLSCWPRHTHHSARWPPALRVCFLQAVFSDKNGRRGLRADSWSAPTLQPFGLLVCGGFYFGSLLYFLSSLFFAPNVSAGVALDQWEKMGHTTTTTKYINNIIDMMFSNIVAAASPSPNSKMWKHHM